VSLRLALVDLRRLQYGPPEPGSAPSLRQPHACVTGLAVRVLLGAPHRAESASEKKQRERREELLNKAVDHQQGACAGSCRCRPSLERLSESRAFSVEGTASRLVQTHQLQTHPIRKFWVLVPCDRFFTRAPSFLLRGWLRRDIWGCPLGRLPKITNSDLAYTVRRTAAPRFGDDLAWAQHSLVSSKPECPCTYGVSTPRG